MASGPVSSDPFFDEKAQIDEFFDDADLPDAPADDLLEVMKKFVQGYAKNLGEFTQALSDKVLEKTWNPENDPISLNMEPFEQVHLINLVRHATDDEQINKVSTICAVLCREMDELTELAESKYYGPLSMFGQAEEEDEEVEGADSKSRKKADEASPEAQMGQFLPFLQDLANFITRGYSLVKNTINQLACLYYEKQRLYLSTFKKVHLEPLFASLSSLLRVFVTLDAIITDNAYIELAWASYKRMIKYVRAGPELYGVDVDRLRSFESCLVSIDKHILSRNIYEGCLSQDYGLPGLASSRALVAGNRALFNEIKDIIKMTKDQLGSNFNQPVEFFDRTALVDLCALYGLHRRLFQQTSKPDKSLYKQLWQLQKKIPCVHLYSQSTWFPAEFLLQHARLDVTVNPDIKEYRKTRLAVLNEHDQSFASRVGVLYSETCRWMVRMESELTTTQAHNVSAVLHARAKLLLNGILLAKQVRNLLTTSIQLHRTMERPFISSNIRPMAVCIEMLKSIEYTYHRRSQMIGENLPHMLGQTAFTLKRVFFPVKKKLDKPGVKLDDAKQHVRAALNLGLSMLNGVPTADRRTVIKIALSIAQLKGTLKDNMIEEVRYQLWKLDLLSTWQTAVTRVCCVDYIYWVMNLVPAMFHDIQQNPGKVNRLQYLLTGLRDPAYVLRCVEHRPDKAYLLKAYKDEVMQYFQEEIIDPLCREVETDLRLHIHSVVLEQANLRKQQSKDLARFLNLKPVNFFDQVIDVKGSVTHYLDTMFYNLTTVTLHDWSIYAEMRNLAYEKYGLRMTEVHLPGHSHYSEALDVLEIMRNIHIFVARYNYNMNTQIFVERTFDQKHLTSINIEHISNSIRTHGTGIMNTTVNFTYQFLCRKFIIFSEFLFDDYIKSRLMKDIRFFKQEKDNIDNKYPMVRAEKFVKAIRKLGVSDDGLTFLDQFRQQITEIGNALGYVRMVRSGGMQYISNAIKFVPDLEDIPTFAESVRQNEEELTDAELEELKAKGEERTDNKIAVREITLSPETNDAARNLDTILSNLSDNFAEGTEYFAILVKVFQTVLKNEKQAHLRNFFAITPPLTLNFVEKMIAQKENIKKKGGRGEASFTDDGFALGLAYILKLLEQLGDFDSLHWFDSVNSHINAKRTDINRQLQKKRLNAEDKQHLQLTLKRLDTQQTEFASFYYSFNGARIFFRYSSEHQEEKKAEEKKAEPDTAAADGAPAPPDAPPAPAAPAPGADGVPMPPPAPAAPAGVIPPPPPLAPGLIPPPPPLP